MLWIDVCDEVMMVATEAAEWEAAVVVATETVALVLAVEVDAWWSQQRLKSASLRRYVVTAINTAIDIL